MGHKFTDGKGLWHLEKLIIILLFTCISQLSLAQSPKEVSGKVVDKASGTSLPGVNVIEKGTTNGTVTDIEGQYRIDVSDNATLIFSSIGYETKEVAVNGRADITITLAEDVQALEEVVVIGYGEQKKVNLTGSVATVSSQELTKRSVPNVENLLQGKVSGLQVVQNSGQPGDDGAVLRIRGMGTFSGAGNAPLVLIDGIQGNLSLIDPNDVETISVLKDAASAAIYGARAANGVILVTTKNGASGSLNIEYHGNVQLHQPTRMPEFVTNSADFMEYWNIANERAGIPHFFTQSEIDAYRNSNDPVKYPNFNWMDFMIGNAHLQNHHLSVNGGTGDTRYNFTLGYVNQDGIVGGHDAQRYNARFRLDSKINDRVKFGGNIGLMNKNNREPILHDSDFILLVYGAGPNYSPYLSDGSGRFSGRYNADAWHNRNPLAVIDAGSRTNKNYSVAAQAYFDVNITKDLVWGAKGAINFDNNFFKHHEHPVNQYWFENNEFAHNGWPVRLGVTDRNAQSLLTTFYSTLTYNKTIGNGHNVTALVGYNQESFVDRYLSGYRFQFPVDYLKELDAGSADGQTTAGSSSEWAIQSLFGRVSYDFIGKYLLEANFRYDGTSRIHKDNRWGVFPSVSAGWRVSEEQFLQGATWMDNLKLRASWGKLGNQNIGLYPYQDILSMVDYPYNSTLEQGVRQTRLTDKSLRWETTTVVDFGFDISIKNGLFSLTADWYDKITDDILYQIPVPASVGLSSPTVNYAKMKNTGFEFEIGHAKKIGELNYNVHLNYSTYKNEVLRVKTPSYGNTTIQEGLPWGSYYLREWIGIFQTQHEIDEGPTHPFNPKPGDLKFKDQNGDGVITDDDRVVIDGAHPDFYYGGGFDLTWKNFDLTAFFQGVQGQKFLVNMWGIDPFTQGTPPTKDFAENAWTPENRTNDYPAMYTWGYGPVTGTTSTYWLQDASYVRLKNLVIGYNLPVQLVEKIGMKNLRVYLSGDNLFTITKYAGADPERTGDGRFATYPQLRVYSAGLKVTF